MSEQKTWQDMKLFSHNDFINTNNPEASKNLNYNLVVTCHELSQKIGFELQKMEDEGIYSKTNPDVYKKIEECINSVFWKHKGSIKLSPSDVNLDGEISRPAPGKATVSSYGIVSFNVGNERIEGLYFAKPEKSFQIEQEAIRTTSDLEKEPVGMAREPELLKALEAEMNAPSKVMEDEGIDLSMEE